MRPYEVMVIFDAGAEPPAIQALVDRLLETVRNADGAPGHVDRWGRRPFAYEVKHRREGYYVLVEFAGVSRTVAELDRMLALADEVLRHKVIRLPEKAARRAAASPARHREGRAPARVAAPAGARAGSPTATGMPADGATASAGAAAPTGGAAEGEPAGEGPAGLPSA